jgi:hypothetical protein
MFVCTIKLFMALIKYVFGERVFVTVSTTLV